MNIHFRPSAGFRTAAPHSEVVRPYVGRRNCGEHDELETRVRQLLPQGGGVQTPAVLSAKDIRAGHGGLH